MKAFVVGFPKSGTTTLTQALTASGINSAHWRVPAGFVGKIIYDNIFAGRAPFAGLEDYQAITQADVCMPRANANHWPNLDFAVIDLIRRTYPECLFILNYREPRQVADSIRRWRKLQPRLVASSIPGLPIGAGGTEDELVIWIENHFAAIRHFFRDSPNFLEIDITAEDAPTRLGEALGIPIAWWGKANQGRSKRRKDDADDATDVGEAED
jgi:hypothetical protein